MFLSYLYIVSSITIYPFFFSPSYLGQLIILTVQEKLDCRAKKLKAGLQRSFQTMSLEEKCQGVRILKEKVPTV